MVDEAKNIGDAVVDLETGQCVLLSCPFCGGPAERRITDAPKRGFIGCFACMIGTPFNVPYGDAEVAAWNARVTTPLAGKWQHVKIKSGNPKVVAIGFETEWQAKAFISSFTESPAVAISEDGLKACPLCGRKALIEQFHDGDDPQPLFVATCEACPIKTYDQFTAAEAARIWNTRAR